VAQNFQQALKFLFGCWHRTLSRPFTLSGRTYEVCLSCGKEFAYARVEFGRSFPKQKEETMGLDRQDAVGADRDMRIDVGIWTGLSTNARDTNRPLLVQSHRIACSATILSLLTDQDMWKATCFIQDEGGNTVKHEAILYISDQTTSSDSVIIELEAEGYEVVSADSSSQGAALLHIMPSVAAVVLNYQSEDRTWFKLAQDLRAIRRGVPIILLSGDPILCLPPWVDGCVGTKQPLEEVASAVHSLLTGEHSEVHSAQC
jgi:hypothetical protein